MKHLFAYMICCVWGTCWTGFPVEGAEFRPAAVTAASKTADSHAAELMLDNDYATYACFLDDTYGAEHDTVPPLPLCGKGALP
jgi:hypothetical protein